MSIDATNPTSPAALPQLVKYCINAPFSCMGKGVIYLGKEAVKNFTFPAAKWAAFNGSNFFAQGAYELTSFTAKAALFPANWLANKIGSSLGTKEFDLLVPARKLKEVTLGEFNRFDQFASDILAPNATAIYDSQLDQYNKIGEVIGDSYPEKFSVINLIAPAIFAGFCARKSMENVGNALHHLKLLATYKRNEVVTTVHATPVNNTQGNSDTTYTAAYNYSTAKLGMDVIIEGLIAAAWATGSYVTYESIIDALNAAGVKDAEWVAQAILVTATTAPTVYRWMKEAYYYSPNSEKNHFGAGPSLPRKTEAALNDLAANEEDKIKLNPFTPTQCSSGESDTDE